VLTVARYIFVLLKRFLHFSTTAILQTDQFRLSHS